MATDAHYHFDESVLIHAYVSDLERIYGKLSYSIPDTIIKVLSSYLQPPPAVIIDNGSATIKAGFSGDDAPKVVFPTVVGGRLKVLVGMGVKGYFIGDEALAKRGVLAIRHPIDHGIINAWDWMEAVWNHTYQQLEIQSEYEDHAVLMTEPPLNPKANREKLTQIMFEDFNIQRFYVTISELLSLYASGRTTGMILFFRIFPDR